MNNTPIMPTQQQLNETPLPCQPKRSKLFQSLYQPIKLATNQFNLTSMQGFPLSGIIYQYSIDVQPQIEKNARSLLSQIIKYTDDQLKNHFKFFFVRGWVLYAWNQLSEPLIIFANIQKEQYQVRFKLTNTHDVQSATRQTLLQIMNSYIKEIMSQLGYIQIGKTGSQYYNSQSKNALCLPQHRIKVWQGFKTTINLSNSAQKLLLQLDFSSRILRDCTVLEFLRQFDSQEKVCQALVGRRIISNYGNSQLYRIDKIDFSLSPLSTFKMQNGTQIIIKDYFQSRYKIIISDLNQPIIIHKNNKTQSFIYLLPEFMNLTGLPEDDEDEDYYKGFNDSNHAQLGGNKGFNNRQNLFKTISQYTCLDPDQRMSHVTNLINQLNSNSSQTRLNLMGTIQQDSQNTIGYELEHPQVQLRNKLLKPQQGQFSIKDCVYNPCDLKDWVLVYSSRGKKDDKEVSDFVFTLIKCSCQLGITMEQPCIIKLHSLDPKFWLNEIKNNIEEFGAPQIILTLIPMSAKKSIYPMLKEALFFNIGVPHQNVVLQTLQYRDQMSICSKILLQINTKVGNPLWIAQMPSQLSHKTMVIGLSMSENARKSNKIVVGFVASIDSQFSKFYSRVSVLKKGSQVISNLNVLIKDVCIKYFSESGKKDLPETLFIYRNANCQAAEVDQNRVPYDTEIQAIIEGFKLIAVDYAPKWAYILINRKNSQRFYIKQREDQKYSSDHRQFSNPNAGTIVTGKRNDNNQFNFFLCAQNVSKGTSTPTLFSVLHNNTDLSEDAFWIQTYYQCFNYQNWQGAVRYPAPAQYAQKLANLARDTSAFEIPMNLSETLFYL